MVSKSMWLKNNHIYGGVRLLWLPTEKNLLHPHEKDSVWDLIGCAAVGCV